eukprot:1153119-Pelagomonas_calceolata.AAC.14
MHGSNVQAHSWRAVCVRAAACIASGWKRSTQGSTANSTARTLAALDDEGCTLHVDGLVGACRHNL